MPDVSKDCNVSGNYPNGIIYGEDDTNKVYKT